MASLPDQPGGERLAARLKAPSISLWSISLSCSVCQYELCTLSIYRLKGRQEMKMATYQFLPSSLPLEVVGPSYPPPTLTTWQCTREAFDPCLVERPLQPPTLQVHCVPVCACSHSQTHRNGASLPLSRMPCDGNASHSHSVNCMHVFVTKYGAF